MKYRRWYPTNTTLADGRVLVVAGQRYGAPMGTTASQSPQAEIPGIYTPNVGYYQTWTQVNTASRRLPFYPWMFQLPDGCVFNAGPNIRTGFLNLTGTTIGATQPNIWSDGPEHKLGSAPHNSDTWSAAQDFGSGNYDTSVRGSGTAVMYQPGKILITGGSGPAGITKKAELLDLTVAGAQWQWAPDMKYARYHVNSTLLADGTVLVTGGNQQPTANDADAVLPAELWTPPTTAAPTGTWTELNAMLVPRLYHSAAVLLPDATVLSVGGGQGGGFTEHADYEIFTPPYLCKGFQRPQITSAPEAVAYGANFTVVCPTASDIRRYGRATLVRLSSVTHSFNMNQRFLELAMPGNSGTQLTLTAPADANLCPPGHYMLFLIAADGTPSHASIIAINPSGCTNTLTVSQSVVSQTDCDRLTQFTVSGSNASAYIWTVNGNPTTSGNTLNLTTSSANPSVQLTVRPSTGTDCGASSALISYFPLCAMPCNCPRPTTADFASPTGQ